MTAQDLLREFIDYSNSLEPKRNHIPKSRGNIFLKNHKSEVENLDISLVSNSVCHHCATYKELSSYRCCPYCSKPLRKTDC